VYPDAKVVLVQRSFEVRYHSFQVVIDGWLVPLLVFPAKLDPGWMGSLGGWVRVSVERAKAGHVITQLCYLG
jgi:hypothetical protein